MCGEARDRGSLALPKPTGLPRRDLAALFKPEQIPDREEEGDADDGVENPVEHL